MGDPGINGKTMTSSVKKSLYERLGGCEVIAELVGNLYDRMLNGPYTWYYWKGRSADSRASERRRYTDLVCSSAGGPVDSQGQDMKTLCTGLGIGRVQWEHFVALAAEALDHSNFSDGEKEDLFCLLARSKAATTAAEPPPSPVGVFAAFSHELSPREMQVLRLVALGNNNSEIAEELFISVNTVTRHLTNIFAKTSTRNRVEAAVYAARRRII